MYNYQAAQWLPTCWSNFHEQQMDILLLLMQIVEKQASPDLVVFFMKEDAVLQPKDVTCGADRTA